MLEIDCYLRYDKSVKNKIKHLPVSIKGTYMRYMILVVSLVVTAFLVMDFNNRSANLNMLTAEHAVVAQKLEQVEGTKAALEAQIAYATSEAAVQEWAYQNHMVQPGDHPVVAVGGSEATATPIPSPTPVQTEMSNPDRWLLLFVDPE